MILTSFVLLWILKYISAGHFPLLSGGKGRKGVSALWIGGICFFLAGGLRMIYEYRPTPVEIMLSGEQAPGKRENTAVLRGKLKTESSRDGSCTLVLRSAVLCMDRASFSLPSVLVTVKEEQWNRMREELPDQQTAAGMGIQVLGKAELITGGRNPGEFDYALYYRSQKIRCRFRASCVAVYDKRTIPAEKWASRLRSFASEALTGLCKEEDRGIYEAVLLGKKTELSEDIRQLYQKNGIAHLLAVSGLHVSLIGMSLYGFLRRIGLRYATSGIAAGILVFFYGILTGFGPSVFRAVFMILCAFLASYLGRTYDLLSAMSLALLLLLLDSPYLLFTSGLQLSFGAVAAIGLVTEQTKCWRMEEEKGRRGSELSEKKAGGVLAARLTDGFLVSLFIQLLTYPVILYHFFEFPIYGIFLNLLVIPLMAYVVGAGIGGVFLYGVSALLPSAGMAVGMTLAEGVIGTGHYILAFYRVLCRLASELPFYSVTPGRPELWKLILYYLILFLFFYLKSGSTGTRKRRFLTMTGLAALFLAFHPVSGLHVVFLDVGQGDGIYMEGKGFRILVDGGSSQLKSLGKSRLVPFLKSRGVSALDYVFVSHGDLDHISGIEYLLSENVDKNTGPHVKNIIFSCMSREDEACKRLALLAVEQGGKVWYMESGQTVRCGRLTLKGLYPSQRMAPEADKADKNAQSLVLLAEYGEFSMLLTGDVENSGENLILEDNSDLPAELTVLKAAHHGSKSSSGKEFIERLKPDVTVLSYGAGNSYGHPSAEVVERLEAAGTRIYRTAESGAVLLHTDGKTVSVYGFAGGDDD